MLNVKVVKNGNRAIVATEGVIDTETAPKLSEALLELDYKDLDLTIDFEKTDYITSAGLRVLLVARKKLTDETMRIINVNQMILEVFQVTGFSSILNHAAKEQDIVDCHLSFKAFLKKRVNDGLAFVFAGREYTWQDVDRLSQIVADDLAKAGVKKGSHVGICSPNSINWIVTFFAVQKLGAIALLVNYGLKPDEIATLAEIGDITHLCYGAIPGLTDFNLFSAALLGGRSAITYMYDIGMERDFTERLSEYDAIKDKYSELYHSDDPSVVIFTSGSTGKPKAVLSSSFNLLNSVKAISVECNFTNADRCCAFLPFFHVFGFCSCIGIGLLYGCVSYIPANNKPATLIDLIREQRCTVFNTVPTMFLGMISQPSFSPEDLSSLRVSVLGGSATSESQMAMFRSLLPNNHFCNIYGMSENAVISMTRYEDSFEHMTQTVGRRVDGIEIEIRNPANGEKVPDGQPGEIFIRSKEMIVCYYRLPIEKQPLDDEGWLATGDLGVIVPEDGYLKLVGRVKDLIIRGGENISPGEIADEVAKLPGVADVKVIGVPHEVLGEEVAAVILLKEGATFDEEAARTTLSGKLAKYKVPAYFVILDKFPLLGSGKIDAITLKKDVLEKLKKG
ncbi:MAG: AMP-binding protein [Clostridia bacterium]|nr:AMP-binding protein [Clostridia bacterium]